MVEFLRCGFSIKFVLSYVLVFVTAGIYSSISDIIRDCTFMCDSYFGFPVPYKTFTDYATPIDIGGYLFDYLLWFLILSLFFWRFRKR